MEFDVKYYKTIQGLTDAIYVCDAVGYISLYNPAAAELWGREPEIGKDLYCGSAKLLNLDGSDLRLEDYPIVKTLKDQQPVHGAEMMIKRADGSYRHIIQYTTPVYTVGGQLLAVVNRQIDITAQREKKTA
jgi:PAS domain S-box-containing protein